MMQGDSYKIPIKITMNGTDLTEADEVEVMIGGIRKTQSGTDVAYVASEGAWLVALTQQDTFRMREETPVTVRVLLSDGVVLGVKAGTAQFDVSQSKVVLKNA